jgi:GT2 family glycosyltransferase
MTESVPEGGGLARLGTWWAKLSLADQARGQVVREVFLGKRRRCRGISSRATLVHVPAEARDLAIELFGVASAGAAICAPNGALDGAQCRLIVLSRRRAGLLLAWHGAAHLPAALWGSPFGALGRVRALIGQAAARAGEVPPYAEWIRLFERLPGDALPHAARLPGQAVRPIQRQPEPAEGHLANAWDAQAARAWDAQIARAWDAQAARAWDAQIAVVAGPPDAVAASLAGAARQHPGAVPAQVIGAAADWAALSASWIVLIQAGEILAPRACAAFARAASFCPWAEMLTADCDRLTADGMRADPLFKPGPDTLMPGSAVLAVGAMAVRRGQLSASLPLRAQTARALLARRAIGRIAHVPGVLSHVPEGHVPEQRVRQGHPAGGRARDRGIEHADPAARRRVKPEPSVTIVVPSAARGAHVATCLRAVSLRTDYENFTIRFVIAAPDLARARVQRAASRVPRVKIVPVGVTPFNYARVNNEAARGCRSDLLLLMNDDVAPIEPDWLNAMVAHMEDPCVGIVGARLLYGNGMVQHEGVIMGLANLCEHAGRLRDAADPGPHGIALLDREVCAVTGACLLIRSCLYTELGGMDEAYAVALNDVDLCLRAREAGWRVIYCAAAVLHHYESLSLGRHYGGARAGLESLEVQRLRARFAGVIEADPFYNPLASLQPGREWQPAFPPRPHPPATGAPGRAPGGASHRAPSP